MSKKGGKQNDEIHDAEDDADDERYDWENGIQ
jgi:hypothetical protein